MHLSSSFEHMLDFAAHVWWNCSIVRVGCRSLNQEEQQTPLARLSEDTVTLFHSLWIHSSFSSLGLHDLRV